MARIRHLHYVLDKNRRRLSHIYFETAGPNYTSLVGRLCLDDKSRVKHDTPIAATIPSLIFIRLKSNMLEPVKK